MSVERFSLDTNVLVYAIDAGSGSKHVLAREIVDRAVERPCVLTVQALSEFVAVVTRKRLQARSLAIAQALDWLLLFPVVAADGADLRLALEACERRRFSLWDGLLLATVQSAGCSLLVSEDMADGSAFEGVTVRNPFLPAGPPEHVKAQLGL